MVGVVVIVVISNWFNKHWQPEMLQIVNLLFSLLKYSFQSISSTFRARDLFPDFVSAHATFKV